MAGQAAGADAAASEPVKVGSPAAFASERTVTPSGHSGAGGFMRPFPCTKNRNNLAVLVRCTIPKKFHQFILS
jgi:hypothetical protein